MPNFNDLGDAGVPIKKRPDLLWRRVNLGRHNCRRDQSKSACIHFREESLSWIRELVVEYATKNGCVGIDSYDLRQLFRAQLSKTDIEAIRESTNKAWALGNAHFQAKITALAGRRAAPVPKG